MGVLKLILFRNLVINSLSSTSESDLMIKIVTPPLFSILLSPEKCQIKVTLATCIIKL